MRFLDNSHWDNNSQLDGLLFFAQLIDEMLFDYTLDSYKPLALNSRLLCVEIISTLGEIRNGYMSEKNLQALLEELKWSLSGDIAAKKLLGVKFGDYLNRIRPNDFKLNDIENIITFLHNSFSKKRYLTKMKECLIEVVEEGKKKQEIRTLTSSFLTELINYNYHPSYIYYQNKNFFFNASKRSSIKDKTDLEDFLSIFDFKETKYTVVFIGGMIFRHFRGTLNSYNIVVTQTYNCFSKLPEDLEFERSRKSDESFVICSEILGYDHHSAREKAETLVGQISSLFNFYHHKERPEILKKCIVQRNSDNYVVIIDKPTKAILKTKTDEKPQEAARSVEDTHANLSLHTESLYRFLRSIDLHGTALASNAIENQLLDLWAALETLLPKNTESNKDRIVQICDSLVPFLQINYVTKQLSELANDFKHWNEEKISETLSKLPESDSYTELEKIGALVSLSSSKELRKKLYNLLEKFPLLKNRLFSLHKALSKPESIKETLSNHSTKVHWHLRRIYRTRGLIIHSGKYPSYTPILVENLHNYLDIFLNKIINLSKLKTINTIEQGVLETQIALDFQIGLLKKHEGKTLDESNFKEALLGEVVQL